MQKFMTSLFLLYSTTEVLLISARKTHEITFLLYSTTELLLRSVRKTKEDTRVLLLPLCKVINKGEGGTQHTIFSLKENHSPPIR